MTSAEIVELQRFISGEQTRLGHLEVER